MFHAAIHPETSRTAGDGRASRLFGRYGPEALAAVTALLFATIFRNSVPEPDVSWQLWIAHQLRMGARLYVDIIETNPPLWFWEAIPLDWAGSLLGVPPRELLVVTIGGLSALSLWSTGRLVPYLATPWRALLLVYGALTLLLMPLFWMGQREQLMLIAALPYAALAAARRDGRPVPRGFAAAIGVAVSFAFALKHYFLIAPALIELWLLIGRRRAYRPLRPETIALAAMAMLYAVAMLRISPEYLTRIVPLNRVAYMVDGTSGTHDMMRPLQFYWLIACAPLLVESKALRPAPLAAALALSACGFAGGWLIQNKGFPYHSVPTTGCLMLALMCFTITRRQQMRMGTLAAMPTILLIPLGVAAWQGTYYAPFAAITRPLLAGLKPQDSVAFVSSANVFAWPDALYRPAVYPSRHYFMWIVSSAAQDRGRTSALAHYAQAAIEDTAQDYRCAQPVRIIFDRMPVADSDMEALFMRNPDFVSLMRHYHRIRRQGQFDLFQRIAPFPAPPAAACRRGV
jgi:hypothetical protein